MRTHILDNDTIILQAFMEYFKETGEKVIRRSELKQLADDRMNSESRGTCTEIANATFHRCLKRISKLGIIDSARPRAKYTLIQFNIPLVKNYLNNIHFPQWNKMSLEQIEPVIWQKIFEKNISHGLSNMQPHDKDNKENMINDLARKAFTSTLGIVCSNSFELYIAHTSLKELIPERSEDISFLVKSAAQFITSYFEPFKIRIEYIGISQAFDKISTQFKHETHHRITPYFIEFAEKVYNYKFSNDEKKYLFEGKIDIMNERVKDLYHTFMNYLSTYIKSIFGQTDG